MGRLMQPRLGISCFSRKNATAPRNKRRRKKTPCNKACKKVLLLWPWVEKGKEGGWLIRSNFFFILQPFFLSLSFLPPLLNRQAREDGDEEASLRRRRLLLGRRRRRNIAIKFAPPPPLPFFGGGNYEGKLGSCKKVSSAEVAGEAKVVNFVRRRRRRIPACKKEKIVCVYTYVRSFEECGRKGKSKESVINMGTHAK